MRSRARLSRVIRLLSMLQSGPLFNATRLGYALGVSKRTIFRDLNLLRDAGIPIELGDNRHGFSVPKEFPSVTPTFEDSDIEIILLAAQLSPVGRVPEFQLRLQKAFAILLSRSPHGFQRMMCRLVRGCDVAGSGDMHSSMIGSFIKAIVAAIINKQRLRITVERYSEKHPTMTIDIHSVRLGYVEDSWWLWGRPSIKGNSLRVKLTDLIAIQPVSGKVQQVCSTRHKKDLLSSRESAILVHKNRRYI